MPNWKAIGKAAGNFALDELLPLRVAARLHAERAQADKEERDARIANDVESRRLQLRQQDLAEAQHSNTLAEQVRQHNLEQTRNLAKTSMPEDEWDAPTAAKMREAGFGGMMRTTTKSLGGGIPQMEGPIGAGAQPALRTTSRGGSDWLAAREAAAERAAQGAATQKAISERASEANQSHEDIARERRQADTEGTPTFAPAALDMAAAMYARSGQLPPMGMGKAGAAARAQILNRAAQYDVASGKFTAAAPPDIAAGKASFGADTASLNQIQKNLDAVSAFTKTAETNAELLKKAIDAVPNTGIPWLNHPIREAATGLGSSAMSSLNAVRQSVQNEYARILSQPNLTGVMTDAARREMEVILSPDATPNQIKTALSQLAAEAKNRRQSYEQQRTAIQGRISPSAAHPAPLSDDELRQKYNLH